MSDAKTFAELVRETSAAESQTTNVDHIYAGHAARASRKDLRNSLLPESERVIDEIEEEPTFLPTVLPTDTAMPPGSEPEPMASPDPDPEPVLEEESEADSASVEPAPQRKRKRTELPSVGFRLHGERANPQVRGLPEALVRQMKEQVARTLVAKDVPPAEAEAFAEKLSLGALTIAALSAQFRVDLDTDKTTEVVRRAFSERDPFMVSLTDEVQALREQNEAQSKQMASLVKEVRDIRSQGLVLEQMASFLVAERAENLLQGVYEVSAADFSHRAVFEARDRFRDEVRRRMSVEKAREGRPIR